MATIKVVTDIAKLPRDFKKFNKNRRFATAVGITWTGQEVKKHLRSEMERVFDRPTRFTLNSLRLRPATRDDWNGAVFFRDFAPKGTAAGVYLDAQIEGGNRRLKRSETHLRRRGFIDPGFFMVPGRDVRLNANGNIPKGQVTKALSDIGAQFNPQQNTKVKRKKFFWLHGSGRRLPGIYWRQGGRLKSFMVAVRRPVYRRRFDFFGAARVVVDRRLERNIERAMRRFASRR